MASFSQMFKLRTPGFNPDAEDEGGAFSDLIRKAAVESGLNEPFLKAVIEKESNYNPKAKSSAGAMGLMQLMPDTAKDLGVNDPYDPEQNIKGGAKYLGNLMKEFNDPEKALAAYNAGPGNVKKYGGVPPFPETQNYVSGILNKLKGTSDLTQPVEAGMAGTENLPSKSSTITPEMLKSFGLDPESQRKEKIANIVRSLGTVVGGATAFNNPAQMDAIFKEGSANQKEILAQKNAKIKSLVDLAKLGKENEPNLVKEYQAYQADELKRGNKPLSLNEWDIARRQAGAQAPIAIQKAGDENTYRSQILDLQKQRLELEKVKSEREAAQKAEKPLSAEAAKTLEIATGGVSAINELRDKVQQGAKIIAPQIFDRDVAALRDDLADRLGRLRSGGAINAGEESRFKRLIPGPLDSKQEKLNKLLRLEEGFKNLGISLTGEDKFNAKVQSRVTPTQQASQLQPKQLSNEDQQAIEWAKSNPNDPRAMKILQIHGAQ